jgi:hypothetical protein
MGDGKGSKGVMEHFYYVFPNGLNRSVFNFTVPCSRVGGKKDNAGPKFYSVSFENYTEQKI